MAETDMIFEIKNVDFEKYLNDTNFMTIPRNCYTVMAGDVGAVDYEVFYKGEKIHDAQGVIRMAHFGCNSSGNGQIDRNEWNKPVKKSINWRKEIGE